MLFREYLLLHNLLSIEEDLELDQKLDLIYHKLFGIKNLITKTLAFYDFFILNHRIISSRIEHDIEYFTESKILTKNLTITKDGLKLLEIFQKTNRKLEGIIHTIENYYDKTQMECRTIPDSLEQKKKASNKKKTKTGVFLYGYEKKSLDFLIQFIIENNIEILADVRFKPNSMNFEFNRTYLLKTLEKFIPGVHYINFACLGIPPDVRKKMRNENDYYKSLLEYYSTKILKDNDENMNTFMDVLKNKRAIIMCKEEHFEECHRSILGARLEENGFNVYWS